MNVSLTFQTHQNLSAVWSYRFSISLAILCKGSEQIQNETFSPPIQYRRSLQRWIKHSTIWNRDAVTSIHHALCSAGGVWTGTTILDWAYKLSASRRKSNILRLARSLETESTSLSFSKGLPRRTMSAAGDVVGVRGGGQRGRTIDRSHPARSADPIVYTVCCGPLNGAVSLKCHTWPWTSSGLLSTRWLSPAIWNSCWIQSA